MSLPRAPIVILCKVVDNFGDIGVVYRLAKALSETDGERKLILIVDDLAAFGSVCPEVDPGLDEQLVRGWTVLRWEKPWQGFLSERPRIVIETFSCGRPDWFEDILFDPGDGATRHIVNLEHLTAEDYAAELHRMPSITRSSLVKKWFFMPGFSAQTGGLIIDRSFVRSRLRFSGAALREAERNALLPELGLSPVQAQTWICVFSYERDYRKTVADLAALHTERPLRVFAAAGKSQACFRSAWEGADRPFPVDFPSFLPQETWDALLLACDFSIVRGEESFSRLALAGRPFLWQAYPQAEAHQLVKVRAFLARIRPYFPESAFAALEALFIAFNDRLSDDCETRGAESLLPVLRFLPAFEPCFGAFGDELMALGDLGASLLTFISEIV
jgi:uncharacterized repeat protein (TIGR03837 family)